MLYESLFLRYSICEEKTFVTTSKCISEENRQAEINMNVAQAGLPTGNELSSLQIICIALNFPEPPKGNLYNEILKRVAEASILSLNWYLHPANNFNGFWWPLVNYFMYLSGLNQIKSYYNY